jgi:hypothetical protein
VTAFGWIPVSSYISQQRGQKDDWPSWSTSSMHGILVPRRKTCQLRSLLVSPHSFPNLLTVVLGFRRTDISYFCLTDDMVKQGSRLTEFCQLSYAFLC